MMANQFKYCIYLISLLLGLGACAEGTDIPTEPDPRPMTVSASGAPRFLSGAASRAADDTDTESSTAVMPETVGVFARIDGRQSDLLYNKDFYYVNAPGYADNVLPVLRRQWFNITDWYTDNDYAYAPVAYWADNSMYTFFAYAPHSSIENTVADMALDANGNMTTFTLNDIPPYSPYDYVVSTSVVGVDTSVSPYTSTVPMSMRHLSARVCVRLKIGKEYSRLRRIYIKDVSVTDRSIGATYYNYSLNISDGYIDSWVSGREYSPTGSGQIRLIPIFNHETGLELDPDKYKQFGSLYVAPQELTTFTFTVRYDVYDLVSDTPIRVDQQATNTISLIYDPATGTYHDVYAESGKYYNINLLVSPAYLYVLSDNDVQPTGLIDIKDPGLTP